MEFFIFISKERDKPWAIYCPSTREYVTAESVKFSVKCKTINTATDYVISHYSHDLQLTLQINPRFAVWVTGQIKWLDDRNVEFLPEIRMV
jgi:hypothetical protein